jgi:S-adenosylmethionine hydrolase
MHRPTIALLTDFGLADTYVGQMKAVILSLAPDAQLIDLTHAIPPGDIRQGAFFLWQTLAHLPSGTTVVAVVDPGVGTARRGIALSLDAVCAVAPDNGLLSYVLHTAATWRAFDLRRELLGLAWPSGITFDGRDIFAPAAARIATGWPIEELGQEISDPVRLDPPYLTISTETRSIQGEIVHLDSFGNCITSIGRLSASAEHIHLNPWLNQTDALSLPSPDLLLLLPSDIQVPFRQTFADVPIGEPLAYVGSTGLLEVAVNQGHASRELGLAIGDRLELCYKQ